MRKTQKAFTLVEVTLFLAISGLLMTGIIAGTSASVSRQRYNDSVNSFTEFLRNVYSEVINVQNSRTSSAEANARCSIYSDSASAADRNPGRSNCAIYGKLVTFGEENAETINVYDVVGNAIDVNFNHQNATAQFTTNQTEQAVSRVIEALKAVKADVVSVDSSGKVTYASGHYTYTPEWQARIENTDAVADNGQGTKFNGAILIVRSPLSGTIHTFTTTNNMKPSTLIGTSITSSTNALIGSYSGFHSNVMNFCINSDDIYAAGNRRRNVRIAADGNTTTSVELVPIDDGGNLCN